MIETSIPSDPTVTPGAGRRSHQSGNAELHTGQGPAVTGSYRLLTPGRIPIEGMTEAPTLFKQQ